jgi:hypothetical protein
MHGWMEVWAYRHAEELIEEARRRHLVRGLRESRRGGRSAMPRFARSLARELACRLADLARSAGVVERSACEEVASK